MDDPTLEVPAVGLRDVTADDLPVFFEHQRDPAASRMAAFIGRDPADREAFDAHWAKLLADETITKKTILYGGQVAGNVMSFEASGHREVCYWIGRDFWGKGIATAALAALLDEVKTRPLRACVAKDNVASLRVLEKCGFEIVGEDRGFANGRGEEVEECILVLDGRARER